MAALETIWNDMIKMRDAHKDTPIEKHCEILLRQMNTASGSTVRHEALAYVLSIENEPQAAR